MKFMTRVSAVSLSAALALSAQSQQPLFSFEDGLDGFVSNAATLFQDTLGATHGIYSMGITWDGPFTWLTDGNVPGLAGALAQNRLLLLDITVPDGGNPAPWLNSIVSFNDPLGWRQTTFFVEWPRTPGTSTLLYDLRELEAPDPDSPWFLMNISANAGGGPCTLYIDNIRQLNPAMATTVMSFENDLHGFNTGGATLSQDTYGATDGNYSMRVEWNGGFVWMFGGNSPELVQALNEGSYLIMDITVPPGGMQTPWSNGIVSFNDPQGWRQINNSYGIPVTEGTRTVGIDLRSLTPPTPDTPWFQLNLAMNGAGETNNVFYIDNIRILRSSMPGDVDGDGCVNDTDLLMVLFAFGNAGGPEDLDNSGLVDDADLLTVLFNFGSGC